MIKKIGLGVIRFEIGGLQRKLWRFRDVGVGPKPGGRPNDSKQLIEGKLQILFGMVT